MNVCSTDKALFHLSLAQRAIRDHAVYAQATRENAPAPNEKEQENALNVTDAQTAEAATDSMSINTASSTVPNTVTESSESVSYNGSSNGSVEHTDHVQQRKDHWGAMFQRLVAFKSRHGHCMVPNRCEEDRPLGLWVSTQRRTYKMGRITEARIAELQDIGFVWCTQKHTVAAWETRYEELRKFHTRYGHCMVPTKGTHNTKLAFWVSAQRKLYKEKRLTAPRIQLLEELGFVWDARRKNTCGSDLGSSIAQSAPPSSSGSSETNASPESRKSSVNSPTNIKRSDRRAMQWRSLSRSSANETHPAAPPVQGSPAIPEILSIPDDKRRVPESDRYPAPAANQHHDYLSMSALNKNTHKNNYNTSIPQVLNISSYQSFLHPSFYSNNALSMSGIPQPSSLSVSPSSSQHQGRFFQPILPSNMIALDSNNIMIGSVGNSTSTMTSSMPQGAQAMMLNHLMAQQQRNAMMMSFKSNTTTEASPSTFAITKAPTAAAFQHPSMPLYAASAFPSMMPVYLVMTQEPDGSISRRQAAPVPVTSPLPSSS